MSDPFEVGVEQLVKLGKCFSSYTRLMTLMGIISNIPPVKLAENLKMSRAGLQKHLEGLIETGFLAKTGSGRNTRYEPTQIAGTILVRAKKLSNLLQTQREALQLESTIHSINGVKKTVSCDTSAILASFQEEFQARVAIIKKNVKNNTLEEK